MGSCLGHCCILGRDFRCRKFFSSLRGEHKKDISLHIELLDDAWSLDDAEYVNKSNDQIPRISSYFKKDGGHQLETPSLDLEWENLPELELSTYMVNVEEKERCISTNSISTCSNGTSKDSLEWDPVIVGMTDLMDSETSELLQEIEMLNSKVLEETQMWSS